MIGKLTCSPETRVPVAAASSNQQSVFADSDCSAAVTLNGSGFDCDSDPQKLYYAWTWGGGSATVAKPTIVLKGSGEHTIELIANDSELHNLQRTQRARLPGSSSGNFL